MDFVFGFHGIKIINCTALVIKQFHIFRTLYPGQVSGKLMDTIVHVENNETLLYISSFILRL